MGNCLGGESEGRGMPRGEAVVWVELATRIPKSLHRALKLHGVTAETSVMDYVVRVIEERLARSTRTPAPRWCTP